jgi:RNA polymerase primary sigma factor
MSILLDEYEDKEEQEDQDVIDDDFVTAEDFVAEDEIVDSDDITAEVEAEERDGPSEDAIQCYLREIKRSKLLNAEEERELALQIEQGDAQARNQMIEANLRLVVKISKRYMNRGLPFLDLIEEGNIGLIKAVERFKISKECRFSTYATWWIRQSIERALINQSRTIRLPVHVSDDINRMVKTSRELSSQSHGEADPLEVAEAMGTNINHVRRLMSLIRKTYSIEHPMGENGDYSLIDTIEDTSSVVSSTHAENKDTMSHIGRFFASLTPTEKKILVLRFGLNDKEPQTLETIGQELGVTRERIRQIEVKSLEKLRRMAAGLDLDSSSSVVRRKKS